MSFAALITCVLLALTVAAAAYAASPENNIILVAIDNAVTTLQNSITNAQTDINAHTDALAPKSLIVKIGTSVASGDNPHFELLPAIEGQTYSGHITMDFDGSSSFSVRLRAELTEDPHFHSTLAYFESLNSSEVNVDFSTSSLELVVVNHADEARNFGAFGIITYTISTDVETLTVP